MTHDKYNNFFDGVIQTRAHTTTQQFHNNTAFYTWENLPSFDLDRVANVGGPFRYYFIGNYTSLGQFYTCQITQVQNG